MKHSPQYILGLVREGHKIQLIKDLRNVANISLRDAKDAVEKAYFSSEPGKAVLDLFKGYLEEETPPPYPGTPLVTPLAKGVLHVMEHWEILGFKSQGAAIREIVNNFD